MHFLSQTRARLVAGLAVLSVALGAGAASATPASAQVPFCNIARPTGDTAYAQCQISSYDTFVRVRAYCNSSAWASSPWVWARAYTNIFIGRNWRYNWDYAGFEPLRCSSGVSKVYVQGTWWDPAYGYYFQIAQG